LSYLQYLEKMAFAQLEKIYITNYLMKLSDNVQLTARKEVFIPKIT